MLAKRLINQLSVSDDYEKLLVTKFKVTDHLLLYFYKLFFFVATMWCRIYIKTRTNDL
jgi:hypothetical protein